MYKYILGIDPGIADTGYGVIKVYENNKMECIDYGSIVTKPKQPLENRLVLLHQELEEIIKKYKPDLFAVEELFFNKNTATALIVAQARGVILLSAMLAKIDIVHYTPGQIKQAVSAFGQANKGQVQKMVKLLLNLKEIPKPDDAADALAVAICASSTLKFN
ncbi:crossover junction endodeoxyribonuclease RuvC [Patescibacteria group bacterium]|nr:crossover junction endodeoxyribonuclease RuvC [Patescibacteria group bacterium]